MKQVRAKNYVPCRLSSTGRIELAYNSNYPVGMGSWDWEFLPGGRIRNKGRLLPKKRWMLDVSGNNTRDPIFLKIEKITQIREIETLRWKTLLHAKGHSLGFFERCERALDAFEDPRYMVEGGRVFKIEKREHHYKNEHRYDDEPVGDLPEDATPIDKLAAIPTPDDPAWKAGYAWYRARRALEAAWRRSSIVELVLDAAIANYIRTKMPEIERDQGPYDLAVIRFTINGRHYIVRKSGGWSRSTGEKPSPWDINVNIDEQKEAVNGRTAGDADQSVEPRARRRARKGLQDLRQGLRPRRGLSRR